MRWSPSLIQPEGGSYTGRQDSLIPGRALAGAPSRGVESLGRHVAQHVAQKAVRPLFVGSAAFPPTCGALPNPRAARATPAVDSPSWTRTLPPLQAYPQLLMPLGANLIDVPIGGTNFSAPIVSG